MSFTLCSSGNLRRISFGLGVECKLTAVEPTDASVVLVDLRVLRQSINPDPESALSRPVKYAKAGSICNGRPGQYRRRVAENHRLVGGPGLQ